MKMRDKISQAYLGLWGSDETQEKSRRRIDWLAKNTAGVRVLDVGCSEGILSILLGREGYQVMGIDINHEALSYANDLLIHEDRSVQKRVTFKYYNILDKTKFEYEFDTVVIAEVIEHLFHPQKAVKNAVCCLKEGGRLLLTTPFGYFPDPDHCQTFTLSKVVEIVKQYCNIDHVSVVDGYIRIIGIAQNNMARRDDISSDAILRIVEEASVDSQKQLRSSYAKIIKQNNFLIENLKSKNNISMLENKILLEANRELSLKNKELSLKNKKIINKNIKLSDSVRKIKGSEAWNVGYVAVNAFKKPGINTLLLFPRLIKILYNSIKLKKKNIFNPANKNNKKLRYVEQSKPEMLPITSPLPQKGTRTLCILDEISEINWGNVLNLERLNRAEFETHISSTNANFAFFESCWKGNGGEWEYAFISPDFKHENAQALLQAMNKLKKRGIKIVFWNKEDPMHFEKFLPVASKADFVFTTDSNMIDRYNKNIGDKRTAVLPFAADPIICNPAGRFLKKTESVCFAGAFYSKGHDERKRQMEYILPAIEHFKGAIYDRYSMLNNDRYAFPKRYQPYIREGVPFSKVVELYKSFKVFLNINTIVDSPTMMSRRVYEIMATGTPVVSSPSRALEEQFPDIVTIASSEKEAIEKVSILLDDSEHWHKTSHRGYREVLTKHTYTQRLQKMSKFARLGIKEVRKPLVSIVIASCRPQNVNQIIENMSRQTYPRLELIYALTPDFTENDKEKLLSVNKRSTNIEKTQLIILNHEVPLGRCLNEAILMSDGEYIAKCDDDNFYLENYISDLMIPFSFGDYSIVGKESYFCYLAGINKLFCSFPDRRHRETAFVAGDAMIIRREVFDQTSFPEKRVGEDTKLLLDVRRLGGTIYSSDHFNFVKYRDGDLTKHTWQETEEKFIKNSTFITNKLDLDRVRC